MNARKVYYVMAAGSKDEVLGAFAAALHFPDYFGGNLDAFFDCLSDFVLSIKVPTTVVWYVDDKFRQSSLYTVILEILNQVTTMSKNETHEPFFNFVIRGQSEVVDGAPFDDSP